MGQLFETIRSLVRDERYVVSQHADERGILEWQVVVGLEIGELLEERPDTTPNPSVEVRETLADGTDVLAVWSHWTEPDLAKLVTVHFFDD